jgi:aryl-alcohol dehydrogenase-like predicted oxidoreductase
MSMQMRFLGLTGLKVSTLGFGSVTFGGADKIAQAYGGVDLEAVRRQVEVCMDAGVNLFDTADAYSAGAAEEILGRALGKHRDQVLISTKLRYQLGPGSNDAGLSRYHIMRACDASLKRLGRDHIDLLYLHEIDVATPLEETVRALDELVRAGKVRYIGVSNFSAWMIMKALSIAERRGWERVIASQVSYSLIDRDCEVELLPLARSEGIGTVVWGPLAGGLLSGKWRRGSSPAEVTRRGEIGDPTPIDPERAFRIIDVAAEIAAVRGVSVAQVALNWIRHQAGVSSVLIGARTEKQLRDNLASAEWELQPEEVRMLDEVSAMTLLDPHGPESQRGHRLLANAVQKSESPGRR